MIILFKNSATCISSWARKYEFNLSTITEMTLVLSVGKCIYINSCFMWAVFKWFANFFPNITFLCLLTGITRFIKRIICRCLQILFHIWHFMHVSTLFISSSRGMSQICFHFFFHDISHHLLKFCVVSAFLLHWTTKYNCIC